MGCTGSSGFKPNTTYPGQTDQIITIAAELGMEKSDVDKMFKSYAKYDAVRIQKGPPHQAGEIGVKDFFLLNQITNEGFAQRMSDSLFFNNKSGMVNFEEFMIIFWHVVTTSEKKLAAFAFKMFDTDNDNILEPAEVITMMETICGHDKKSYARLHDAFSHIGKIHMSCTLEEFEHLVQENSTLLFPVFDMQLLLRDRTVGSRFLYLQEVKTQRFGANKTLTEILSNLKHKPDFFVHRNDPKGAKKKPTAVSHPPPTSSGSGKHVDGKHSPGPHNEAKHKGDKTRKAHGEGYHSPSRGSFDNTKSSSYDPTKSERQDHPPSRKHSIVPEDPMKSNHHSSHGHSSHGHSTPHGHSSHGLESATKSHHDHHKSDPNKSGHEKDGNKSGTKAVSSTKHTHDYIASHKTGKEFHDATEHHDLILHGKDDHKKSKEKEEEKKSAAAHHYHDKSHHDEREKHSTLKPKKSVTAETAGWHANI